MRPRTVQSDVERGISFRFCLLQYLKLDLLVFQSVLDRYWTDWIVSERCRVRYCQDCVSDSDFWLLNGLLIPEFAIADGHGHITLSEIVCHDSEKSVLRKPVENGNIELVQKLIDCTSPRGCHEKGKFSHTFAAIAQLESHPETSVPESYVKIPFSF